jgi:hypothetical protein
MAIAKEEYQYDISQKEEDETEENIQVNGLSAVLNV